jgi:hypothetical protein
LKKEKKYNGKLESTELIRVTLPPIERIQPFQVLRRFFVDSIIGNHVDLLLGLAPTGIPRKRKGIDSTAQCKKEDDALKKLSSILMP